jgi:hypothetical protein
VLSSRKTVKEAMNPNNPPNRLFIHYAVKKIKIDQMDFLYANL